MRKARKIRALRHWKQRFDKNARFIWRRPIVWMGVQAKPGDPVPKSLEDNKVKLRRFWNSGAVELAEFEAPDVATGQAPDVTTGQAPATEQAPTIEPVKEGSQWVIPGHDKKFTSKKKALAFLAECEASKEEAPEEETSEEEALEEEALEEEALEEEAPEEEAPEAGADDWLDDDGEGDTPTTGG